jgi:ATP-dependent Lhr-like helicase
VSLVAPPVKKRIEFRVEWPAPGAFAPGVAKAPDGAFANEKVAEKGPTTGGGDEGRYDAVIPAIAERLEKARSVLVFTDSRRRAERMARLLNEFMGPGTAYAHHGSLAKEARLVVEERFKAGELRCVVATASLELGMDVGSVDEVVLAGAPPEVSAALQRAGRSGHGVGATSRAVIYPFHGMDLLRSAAVVRGAEDRAVEILRIPRAPLDVLAQVLLAMSAARTWPVDELYESVLSFPPFERLSRRLFDATMDMLAGRYAAGARLRELEPRVYLDAATRTVRARDGVRALLYSSGGAIPDRGHYALRLAGGGAKIGELDEEFVFERSVGDAFTLGAQSWRIVDIGAEAVEVQPLGAGADFIPFWKAEARYRSAEVSSRLLGLMDRLCTGEDSRGFQVVDKESGKKLLVREYGFSEAAARVAVDFVAAQAAAGRGALPGSKGIAVEVYADPVRRGEAHCFVVHTLLGGGVNEPLGLALAASFEENGMPTPEVISDDDFVLLVLPAAEETSPAGTGAVEASAKAAIDRVVAFLSSMGSRERVEGLVRRRLEGSGLFGAQFRENAGRALLLPRGVPGKRMPLWITRLKAKRLFEAVRAFPDFPVTAETWRSCLVDLFDMDALCGLLAGIAESRIRVSAFSTRTPSPFAREAIWRETGEFMYRGDAMLGRVSSSLSDAVIADALRSSRLRPRLAPGLIDDFVRSSKRLREGWGPRDAFELAEWVKERVVLPVDEFDALIAEGGSDLASEFAVDPTVGGRLERLFLPGAVIAVLLHAERNAEVQADPAAFIAEWLRREGPVPPARIAGIFGLGAEALSSLLDALEDSGDVVIDEFRADSSGIEVIDAENLEILLRLARRAARPVVEARPPGDLFRLVASLQGLAAPGRPGAGRGIPSAARTSLAGILDALSGLALPARLWESEVFPARIPRYASGDLDALLAEEARLWFGAGRESLAFCRADELELHGAGSRPSAILRADESAQDFWTVRERLGLDSRAAAFAIWDEAWEGLVASEGFDPVRKGLANRFGKDLPGLEDVPQGGEAKKSQGRAFPSPLGSGREPRIPRALRERWRSGAPVGGRWFSLELPRTDGDALDEEEAAMARVRIVVARFGLLHRGLLEHESADFRWAALFPAMRRMELRGELVYGRFFEGLEGPQFLGQDAFELFAGLDDAPPPGPCWLSALDPAVLPLALATRAAGEANAGAAVVGPGSVGADLDFPERIPSNRLGVSRGRLAAVLSRSGAELRVSPSLDETEAVPLFQALTALRDRLGKRIGLETIDGGSASASPWAATLKAAGFEADRGRLVLW